MLVYKPSTGNLTTKVSIDRENRWFGKSLGGPIIDYIYENKFPNKKIFSDLSNESNWFFNPITDWDIINGSTTYRSMYIGASERHPESEIIGNFSPKITFTNNIEFSDIYELICDTETVDTTGVGTTGTTGTDTIDTTGVGTTGTTGTSGVEDLLSQFIEIDFAIEGVFNNFTGKNTIVLDDEKDSTNKLNGMVWKKESNLDRKLLSGEYYKIWFRIRVKNNTKFLNTINFNLILYLGSIYFTIPRINGRLTLSNVYQCDLNDDKFLLREFLPYSFCYDEVIKSYSFNDLFFIVYFYQNKLKLLSIKTDTNINNNKYLEINLSENIDKLVIEDDLNYTDDIVEPISKTDKKYFSDIVKSHIDRNFLYLFYNILTEKEQEDYYGYDKYKWSFGVVNVDLSNINEKTFENIESGYNNRGFYNNDYFIDFKILDDRFLLQVETEKDLIYLLNDDYENNEKEITYIWEGDILSQRINPQKGNIGFLSKKTIKSMNKLKDNKFILKVEEQNKIKNDTLFNREIFINNSIQTLRMGPPNQKVLKTENSSISLEPCDLGNYSFNCNFNIRENNIYSNQIDKRPQIQNDDYPYQFHTIKKERVGSDFLVFERFTNYQNKFNKILELENGSLSVSYNFYNNIFRVNTLDYNFNNKVTEIDDLHLYLSTKHTNTINLNVFKQRSHGKYSVKYHIIEIYINGSRLGTFETFSSNEINNNIIINPKNDLLLEHNYYDIRNYLENMKNFSKSFFRIHNNITYTVLEPEVKNPNHNNDCYEFNYRRKVNITNYIRTDNTIMVPIVLQGNSYKIEEDINEQIKRQTFDFNHIDIFNPNFKILNYSETKELEYYIEEYDTNKDLLVIWVKAENLQESIVIYYGNSKVYQNSYDFSEFHNIWLSDKTIEENIKEIDEVKLYSTQSDIFIYETPNKNLYKYSRHNFLGKQNLYKSNKIDIRYNRSELGDDQNIDNFILKTSKEFLPSTVSIREIKNTFEPDIENGE